MRSKVKGNHPECPEVQDKERVGVHPGHRGGCLDLRRAFAASHDRPLPLTAGAENDDFGQAPVCDGDRSVRTYGDASRPEQCFVVIEATGTPDLTPGELRRPGTEARVRYSLTIGVSDFTRSGCGQVATGDQGDPKRHPCQPCRDASNCALRPARHFILHDCADDLPLPAATPVPDSSWSMPASRRFASTGCRAGGRLPTCHGTAVSPAPLR